MKTRDYFLDNIKFILIFLVVLGHYCGCYLNSKLLLGCYDAIYSFHMPAFIILSGYLSKNIKQQRYKDIDTILLPYIAIQIIYILYRKFLGLPQLWSLTIPIDANWYLLGLFIWRLMIPYFNYIKYPIVTSILIALGIGYINDLGEYLDLERIISFFPYFVIGYFSPSYIEYFTKVNYKITPYLFFALIMISFFLFQFIFPGKGAFIKRCLIPTSGYDQNFGKYAEYGLIIRALSYIFSLSISFLFFAIVPKTKTWFSELGSRTINVFLFHLVLLYLVGKYIFYHSFYTELLALPIAAIITLLLSGKFLAVFFDRILNLHHFLFEIIVKVLETLHHKINLGSRLKHI